MTAGHAVIRAKDAQQVFGEEVYKMADVAQRRMTARASQSSLPVVKSWESRDGGKRGEGCAVG